MLTLIASPRCALKRECSRGDRLRPLRRRFSKQPRNRVAPQGRLEGEARTRFDCELQTKLAFLPGQRVCFLDRCAGGLPDLSRGVIGIEIVAMIRAKEGASDRALAGSVDARQHEDDRRTVCHGLRWREAAFAASANSSGVASKRRRSALPASGW